MQCLPLLPLDLVISSHKFFLPKLKHFSSMRQTRHEEFKLGGHQKIHLPRPPKTPACPPVRPQWAPPPLKLYSNIYFVQLYDFQSFSDSSINYLPSFLTFCCLNRHKNLFLQINQAQREKCENSHSHKCWTVLYGKRTFNDRSVQKIVFNVND